jgi:hypothetical protein
MHNKGEEKEDDDMEDPPNWFDIEFPCCSRLRINLLRIACGIVVQCYHLQNNSQ